MINSVPCFNGFNDVTRGRNVIDFQSRHRPDLRKPWIFISRKLDSARSFLHADENVGRGKVSVTGSCSFSLEIFLFSFLYTISLDIVVCTDLSRSLSLAVFGDVWRWGGTMFGDDVSFEGFFFLFIFRTWKITFDFILHSQIWSYFSLNLEEIIELKNVKWFSWLWFKESYLKDMYV